MGDRLRNSSTHLTKSSDQVEEALPSKEAILQVLTRASVDNKFLARLAENPDKVLQEFDLTEEETTALANGDAQKIESWIGKLDEGLKVWPKVRAGQNKW